MGKITYHQVGGGPDGISVVVADDSGKTITMTEEEFEEVAVTFATVMEPIYAARAKAKREAETARLQAAWEKGLETVEIGGEKARLQYEVLDMYGQNPRADKDNPLAAWLDGHTRQSAPFVVERENFSRRYSIKGRNRNLGTSFGQKVIRREEVYGPSGGVMRFATAEAAFKRAIKLNLHKVEAITE